MDEVNEREQKQGNDLKLYETPDLIEYGSVATLTQSGAVSVANDGQTHRSRRP